MSKNTFSKSTNSYLLLTGCVLLFVGGVSILFLGALSHINPNMNFTALFSKEPIMNLVYSVIPRF